MILAINKFVRVLMTLALVFTIACDKKENATEDEIDDTNAKISKLNSMYKGLYTKHGVLLYSTSANAAYVATNDLQELKRIEAVLVKYVQFSEAVKKIVEQKDNVNFSQHDLLNYRLASARNTLILVRQRQGTAMNIQNSLAAEQKRKSDLQTRIRGIETDLTSAKVDINERHQAIVLQQNDIKNMNENELNELNSKIKDLVKDIADAKQLALMIDSLEERDVVALLNEDEILKELVGNARYLQQDVQAEIDNKTKELGIESAQDEKEEVISTSDVLDITKTK